MYVMLIVRDDFIINLQARKMQNERNLDNSIC